MDTSTAPSDSLSTSTDMRHQHHAYCTLTSNGVCKKNLASRELKKNGHTFLLSIRNNRFFNKYYLLGSTILTCIYFVSNIHNKN